MMTFLNNRRAPGFISFFPDSFNGWMITIFQKFPHSKKGMPNH